MKLLVKDQLRKIKSNPFNFISLSILVFVIALSFTAVKASIRRLDANYDEYLETQQVEDFYFVMGEIDIRYIGGTAIDRLCEDLDLEIECRIAFVFEDDPSYMNRLNIQISEAIKEKPEIYENLIDSFAQSFAKENNFEIEKSFIIDVEDNGYTYKFKNQTEEINLSYLVEGEFPALDNEIAIFPEFAELNNLSIGDSYIIKGTDYKITGYFYQPEYTFPIMSLNTIEFDPAKQTLVLANENTVKNLNMYEYIKYGVKGDLTQLFDDYGYDTIQSGDFSFLGKQMQIVYMLLPRDINFRIISLDLEVNNANAFIDIFLPIFVGFVTLLLVIFMRRYVENNQKDINTLHALGYTKGEITLAILIYPFLISLASIPGYLLGLILSNQLFDLYSSRYFFPKAEFIWDIDLIIYSVLIPIIVIVILNYIFIHAKIAKKPRIKKIKLHIFKFTTLKTTITSLLLFTSISVMVTFGLNGNSMFSAFIDYTKTGNNYSTMVNLRNMTNTNHLDTYEAYTRLPGKILEVNSRTLKKETTTTIYGIDTDNTLKILIDNDIEKNKLLNEGVIISDYLQTNLNLQVGDLITFSVGGVQTTEKIVGVSNELIENNFYMLKEDLNQFYQLNNSYYNGLFLTDNLYESDEIISTIDYLNSLDEISAILSVSNLVLNFLIVLSIFIALFIFILMILNYYRDNNTSIAVLKSIGYSNIEISKKYLLSIYIILVLSYVISIPITIELLNYMLSLLMDNLGFKLILEIKLLNILFGFILLNILFVVISYLSTRYYDKVSISELMKLENK